MSKITVEKISGVKGAVKIPGDKSISHRAVMLSSIAQGKSRIMNMLESADCMTTVDAFRSLGISIDIDDNNTADIIGKGLRGLAKPVSQLYMGNSGTTMRLLMGILAGQDFTATLTGDESLSKRPMSRVTHPLRMMGARIDGTDDANLAPITIQGGKLRPISYVSPVASAQVKSSIMLAGLYADGITELTEPHKSRDHTERMLELYGVGLKQQGLKVALQAGMGLKLNPQVFTVPGDISSAAFFIVLATLIKGAELVIRSCGINPTRIGILNVLERMGADIELDNIKEAFEPIGDIIIKGSRLKATEVTQEEVPLLIDEVPLIALCATQAEGTTVIRGLKELRVKESDRLSAILTDLKAIGASIRSDGDDLIIKGPTRLKAASVESFGDHRIAMMMIVAGCLAEGRTTVNDTGCIGISFPNFMDILNSIVS